MFLVLVQEPSFTGCLIEVRPVGILNMVDAEEGDQKVLAVPTRNPRYDQIHTMDQIFSHVRREIEHFFTIYKELEGTADAHGRLGRTPRSSQGNSGQPLSVS